VFGMMKSIWKCWKVPNT